MKNLAIVMAGNDAISFALANVIIGLKRHNEHLVSKIFIYHDLNDAVREKMAKIWAEKIEFIPYKRENFLYNLALSDPKFEKILPKIAPNSEIPAQIKQILAQNEAEILGKIPIPQNSRWSHFIYAKFHIFEHLGEFENVVWLDSDCLILGEISEILCENGEADIKIRRGEKARNCAIFSQNLRKF